jgi:hypothetical protein
MENRTSNMGAGNKVVVDHEGLDDIIDLSYRAKLPLFIKGTTGIGKSDKVREKAEEFAGREDREFVKWHELDKQEKHEVIENIVDYFVYIDIRLSSYEPADIKGIPDLEQEALDFKPPLWAYAICQDGAKALVFMDEANLAPPSVQSTFYQLVLDNKIGSRSVSEGAHIVSAGNREGKDRANIHSMAAPLKNRFIHAQLRKPQGGKDGGWTKWAIQNDIDDRIISFVGSSVGMDKLFTFDENNKDADVFATPRTWEYASQLLDELEDKTLENIREKVALAVGTGTASEFKGFLEKREDLNMEEYKKNPEKVNNLDVDKKFAVITGFATMYDQNPDEMLPHVIDLAYASGEDEFQTLLLTLCKRRNPDKFTQALNDPNFERKEKYSEVADEISDLIL